jgi:hypothetical protein
MSGIRRIFLAALRADVDPHEAHEHWVTDHASVFRGMPDLLGYVQNRPLPDMWSGLTHVCSETWFCDRATERVAFESHYYLTDVADDEARFVQRDDAWLSVATAVRSPRRRYAYRVLAFGHSPQSASDRIAEWDPDAVEVLSLHRRPPTGGRRSAIGLWTDDVDLARGTALHFGPLCLLSRPVAVVVPPEPPWTPREQRRKEPER